jgi:hypothetical protein
MSVLILDIKIKIIYNYLSKFDRIRIGDCERPLMKFIDPTKIGLFNHLYSQVYPINSLSRSPTLIYYLINRILNNNLKSYFII